MVLITFKKKESTSVLEQVLTDFVETGLPQRTPLLLFEVKGILWVLHPLNRRELFSIEKTIFGIWKVNLPSKKNGVWSSVGLKKFGGRFELSVGFVGKFGWIGVIEVGWTGVGVTGVGLTGTGTTINPEMLTSAVQLITDLPLESKKVYNPLVTSNAEMDKMALIKKLS